MANIVECGPTYIFVSEFDGSVLDLNNADPKSGNKFKSWKSNGNAQKAQQFVVSEGTHGLIISCVRQGEERTVLDNDLGNNELCNYTFHGGKNQHWEIIKCDDEVSKVRIRSCADEKYLINSGIGKNIKIRTDSKKGKDVWIPVQITC